MNEEIKALVDQRLNKIFNDYPETAELSDLKEELSSDLMSSAEDKLTDDMTPAIAVEKAFKEFGDIDEVINQVLNDNHQNEHHKHTTGHTFNIDNSGISIDNGKLLNINDDGITVNNGKTIKINDDGIKFGNLVINDNGINFKGNTKSFKKGKDKFDSYFDKEFADFDVDDDFDDDNFNTEVHVETLPLTDEYEFDYTGLNKIRINYKNADLKILPTADDKIKISEYMSRTNPNYQVKTDLTDGVLSIKQGEIPHFLPLKIRVKILIPKAYVKTLQVINDSGNLQVQSMRALEKAVVECHSGAVYLNNFESQTLLLDVNSGKLTLDHVLAKEQLAINDRSGLVNMDTVATSKFDISSRSGSIKGTDFSGAGNIMVKSGTIHMNFDKVTGDINVENNSGTVKLKMPEDDSYKFDLEAQSGIVHMKQAANLLHDIMNLKEGTVGNDPQYQLTVHAKSGIIKVS
ncbi:DUF4097 family beta strand repeat-containing protein [Companilactobacillus kimchii]|uniref:DUF4097 domain-containing protein n=2 Tax=Companilactobacillus kimchii TaxID=2801452 RepID=A0ABR5NX07_9LACO|nr:DUF4097 family beta strand repeat-containing protein [Companilactobacillus kimchii]KAE9561171.1 hypothetical protein ATN91_06935 [Companilactobacillus kimchii]KRK53251.1 hypothetical protein FC97_GL001722 [Companilactobacillus kimchii DSM 13961 = JCM 10707]OWF32693.1 hypothetical protein LKACC12383_01565 [Companilactobacillus kimchii]GEO47703.1 hypothetical protein LKI01_17020 [Companilactobacillus paralimentarius]